MTTNKIGKSVSVQRVIHNRNNLYSCKLLHMVGVQLDQKLVDEFTSDICLFLSLPMSAVRQSLRHFMGKQITEADARSLAWRIAGNLHRLRKDRPLPPWVIDETEWCAVQIQAVRPDRRKRGAGVEPGHRCLLTIIDGAASGKRATVFLSHKFQRAVALRFGFKGHRDPSMRLVDGMEFYNMRFMGILRENSDLSVSVVKVAVPPSMLKYNRGIISKRARKGFTCPRRFSHACRACPIGETECEAAVRPATCEKGACVKCGKAYWKDTDPFLTDPRCHTCAVAEKL